MNPYETLGVDPDASPDEIKKAYRREAKKHHPDKPDGSEEKFGALVKSYGILTDPDRRAKFDRTGETEDRSFEQHQADIRSAVSRLLDEILNSPLDLETTDVQQSAVEHLAKIRVAIVDRLTGLSGKLNRAKKMRKRFRKAERKRQKAKVRPFGKDEAPPPPGIVEAALEAAEASVEREIETTTKTLHMHDQVTAVFEAMTYDFEAPPPPEPRWSPYNTPYTRSTTFPF